MIHNNNTSNNKIMLWATIEGQHQIDIKVTTFTKRINPRKAKCTGVPKLWRRTFFYSGSNSLLTESFGSSVGETVSIFSSQFLFPYFAAMYAEERDFGHMWWERGIRGI